MSDRVEIWVGAGGGARDYPVILESGIRHRLPELLGRFAPEVVHWVVVSDENVGPLHAGAVSASLARAGLGGGLHTVPAGEEEKTRARWGAVTDALFELGVGRDGGVVAVGGGVVGDLAGFVAATFMRGIPVVQVPTSTLAMIDASVGGKTGVDTPAGKNLVGAFHAPSLVAIDPETAATLPRELLAQGLVEAVKHGAIFDEGYGDAIAAAAPGILDGDLAGLLPVVARSVEIKADVVTRDEREGGLRETLNFGHTVAHALERSYDYRIPHGTAVAHGMLCEARLGEEKGVSEPGTAARVERWLAVLGLGVEPGPGHRDRFVDALRRDKKVRDGTIRVVLLNRPGSVRRTPEGAWAHPVSVDEILALLT